MTSEIAFKPGIVFVTTGSQEEAQRIASALVEEHLAACVKIFPVASTYRWQEKVTCDSEWQLLIKTDLRRFDELKARVAALHSYIVPETIAIAALESPGPYQEWLRASTSL